MKILLVYPNLMLQTALPNNIALLSSYLKAYGHSVCLFDTTYYNTEELSTDERRVKRLQVKPFDFNDARIQVNKECVYESFKKLLEDYKPSLVAITLLDDTLDLAFRLLKHTGNVPVIAGGVSAILDPGRILGNDDIDFVCIGEGEHTIVEICDYIQGVHGIEDVRNIGYKKDGVIKFTWKDNPIDINSLLMEDYTIFDEKRFYRPMLGKMVKSIPVNLDRGCPYKCSFCCSPSIKKKIGSNYYRMKTVSRIESEIKHQLGLKPDIEFLYFNSESFLIRDIDFLYCFAGMYEQFSIPFWCQANISTVSDEKIKLLKEMGCVSISIGLESGDETYRKTILKKHFSNQQVLDVFKIFKKYDLPVSINNIIGFPDETRKQIFKTISLNRKIYHIYKKTFMSGFIFQPYHGTELYDYCLSKNYINNTTKTDTVTGDPTVFNPYLSSERIVGMLNTFSMYIKFPFYYYPLIWLAERNETILNLLRRRYWNVYG